MPELPDIISIDVKCPWCGAEPGEQCREGDSSNRYGWRYVRQGYGHLARTEKYAALSKGGQE